MEQLSEYSEFEDLFEKVHLYSEFKQYQKQAEVSSELIAKYPDSYVGYFYLGQALFYMDQYKKAIEVLNQGLAQSPENEYCIRLLMMANYHYDENKEAESYAERLLELEPDDYYAWYYLGLISIERSKIKDSRKYFKKAIEIDPNDDDGYNMLGRAELSNADQPTLKIKDLFLKALELNPENADALNNLGEYHLNTGDLESAEDQFRNALKISPQDKDYRRNLIKVLLRKSTGFKLLSLPGQFISELINLSTFPQLIAAVIILIIAFAPGIIIYESFNWHWDFFTLGVPITLLVAYGISYYPLVKLYEWTILKEIRIAAGERRKKYGGLFGFHSWPISLRMSLFIIILIGIFASIVLAATIPEVRGWSFKIIKIGIWVLFILGIIVHYFFDDEED